MPARKYRHRFTRRGWECKHDAILGRWIAPLIPVLKTQLFHRPLIVIENHITMHDCSSSVRLDHDPPLHDRIRCLSPKATYREILHIHGFENVREVRLNILSPAGCAVLHPDILHVAQKKAGVSCSSRPSTPGMVGRSSNRPPGYIVHLSMVTSTFSSSTS